MVWGIRFSEKLASAIVVKSRWIEESGAGQTYLTKHLDIGYSR